MPSINLCILGGHLTRDPEMRYTPSGTPVLEFGLAVNRKWRDQAGALQEEVSFFDCVAFGKTAETINEYFGKGGAIMVEGRLKQESWEDKATGKPRYKVKVIVEKFHFVGDMKKEGGGGGDDPGRRPPARQTTTAPAPATTGAPPADPEDDVPF